MAVWYHYYWLSASLIWLFFFCMNSLFLLPPVWFKIGYCIFSFLSHLLLTVSSFTFFLFLFVLWQRFCFVPWKLCLLTLYWGYLIISRAFQTNALLRLTDAISLFGGHSVIPPSFIHFQQDLFSVDVFLQTECVGFCLSILSDVYLEGRLMCPVSVRLHLVLLKWTTPFWVLWNIRKETFNIENLNTSK